MLVDCDQHLYEPRTLWYDHADPAESTDSRQFGPIPGSAVVGRPVFRYAPIGRFGLVR